MSNPLARFTWRPTRVTLIAGVLVILGFALSDISWKFLSLTALGTFGPGILRELGWLRDKDEFEMRAARRAGYHAYLVTGLLAFVIVAFLRSGEPGPTDPTPVVTDFFVLLWFTWLLSSLLSYWGPQKTAIRILIIFGSAWFLFVAISHISEPTHLGMEMLVVVPFFTLAYVARRWPRIAGVFLIAAAGFFFYFFGLYEIFGDKPLEKGRGTVLILFMGPLLASGIALLRVSRDGDEELLIAEQPPTSAG
jgi:hypothetical protein